MANPHLVRYVKEQLKAGHTLEKIRKFLLGTNKYPPQEVQDAVKAASPPGKAEAGLPVEIKGIQEKAAGASSKKEYEVQLRRIGILSTGKVMALAYLLVGLVFTLLFVVPLVLLGVLL